MFGGVERNVSPTDKVRCPRPGVIMAFAGSVDNEVPLFTWQKAGGRIEDFPQFGDKADFEMVLITADGAFHYCDEAVAGSPVSLPFCLGSGAKYARGALNYCQRKNRKITAKEAVEAAADSDVNTGGEIKSAMIAELLGPAKRKRRRAK